MVFLVARQATSPAEERQDVTVLYNKMTLGELQSTFNLNVSAISLLSVQITTLVLTLWVEDNRTLIHPPHFVFQGFNWTRFIQGVLSSVSIEVQQEEEVVVYSSPYLEKMNDVLSKHSVRSVRERHANLSTRYRNSFNTWQQFHKTNACLQDRAELPHLAAHHRQS